MAAPKGTTARYFDDIVALVAGGIQIKTACESRPEFPNWVAFKQFLRKHPEHRARLDAVRPVKPVAKVVARLGPAKVYRRWTEADFDMAVAALRASNASSIHKALTGLMPKGIVFGWAKRSAPRMSSLRAALAARPRPGRFTDEAFNRALEIIKSTTVGRYEDALVAAGNVPPRWAVQKRKIKDAEFRTRFKQARAVRTKGLRKIPQSAYGYAMLRTGLMRDDLYREARAAIPVRIDPETRDDMISEIVVAVMEGRLARESIRSEGYQIGRQYERKNNPFQFDALERTRSDGSGDQMMIVDTAAAAGWSFEGAI